MKIKNKIFLIAVVCLSTYFVTQSMQQQGNVTLESSDKQQSQIPIDIVKKSITIKNLIEDLETQEPIYLPNVSSKVLRFILELLRDLLRADLNIEQKQELISGKIINKINELSSSNPIFGYDFLAAVNYLDIPDLLPFAIDSVSQLMNDQIKEGKKDDLKYGLKLIPKGSPLENQIREIVIGNNISSLNQLISLKKVLTDSDTSSSVAFSPDSKYILTGSEHDKTAKLWDTNTGNLIRIFADHTERVNPVAFSPDSKYILTGSNDKTARLWDTNTGNLIRIFAGHTKAVNSVAFSPDSKYILTGSDDKTARLWDTNTGNLIRTFIGNHINSIISVAFSPDGKYILTGSNERANLRDRNTGNLIRTLFIHSRSRSPVTSVKFSPDGKYILTGFLFDDTKLWNINTGNLIRTFTGHTEPVTSVAFSPDGKYILIGSFDKTAKLWDISVLKLDLESIVFVLLFKY